MFTMEEVLLILAVPAIMIAGFVFKITIGNKMANKIDDAIANRKTATQDGKSRNENLKDIYGHSNEK